MTKGYKATYNYRCKNQVYEVGQEYKLNEKPIMCVRGFHYCKNAKDTLNYYAYTHAFKLLEIEDLSCSVFHKICLSIFFFWRKKKNDKSCSNHIRIVREITNPNELFQLLGCIRSFNEFGQELRRINSNGEWSESTYNEFGQELTLKSSSGFWRKRTYNSNGRELTCEDSDGFWHERTYNENNELLMYRNSSGTCNYY